MEIENKLDPKKTSPELNCLAKNIQWMKYRRFGLHHRKKKAV